MNKKGITPIIAVVLLLMMTVAAGGLAFYWLTKIQEKTQVSIESQESELIRDAATSLNVISQNFNSSSEILKVDLQNNGKTAISVNAEEIVGIIKDGNGKTVCASMDLNSTNFQCDTTTSCYGFLSEGSTKRIEVNISKCGTLSKGSKYQYEFKFKRGASVSGFFSK